MPTPDDGAAVSGDHGWVRQLARFVAPHRRKVAVALGGIAFKSFFNARKKLGMTNPAPLPAFGHGVKSLLSDGLTIISSYHPSQQNTQTGRVTPAMYAAVLLRVRSFLKRQSLETGRTAD